VDVIFWLQPNQDMAMEKCSFEDVSYFGQPVTRDSPCVQVGAFADGIVFR
jgi:hypothetical protein